MTKRSSDEMITKGDSNALFEEPIKIAENEAAKMDEVIESANVVFESAKDEASKIQKSAREAAVRIKKAATRTNEAAMKMREEAEKAAKHIMNRIENEKKAWEEEKHKIEGTRTFDKIIKLNVGGMRFDTSLTTLTSIPGSMLASMFSGRHGLPEMDDGSIFIDRDGTYFRHILNYLRDPFNFSKVDLKDSQDDIRLLMKEMHYFNIPIPKSLYYLPDEFFIGDDNLVHFFVMKNGTRTTAVARICRSCGYTIGSDKPIVPGFNRHRWDWKKYPDIPEDQPAFSSDSPCPSCNKEGYQYRREIWNREEEEESSEESSEEEDEESEEREADY
mmetsp:Transcript_13285/g.17741  ORF Transcript_13285/g.17741 Transcript_13285/m.17741 type:complete len:331 (-) Transcript_13285:22-1014(-)